MPGFGSPTLDAPVIVGFRTRAALDVAEYQSVETAWAETRTGDEIHGSSFTGVGSTTVQQLQSGFWGLVPLNSEPHWQHETTDGEAAIVPLSDFHAASGMAARPTFKPPAAPGLVPAAQTKTSPGDFFLSLLHQAGESVSKFVASALGAPPMPPSPSFSASPNVPVNRVLEGKTPHAEDTGYLLRFWVPGNPFSRSDITLRFYFGGPLSGAGHGQFCVAFSGGGLAWLYEFVSGSWALRMEWRFCNPQDALMRMHVVRILPHAGAYIEFQSQLADTALAPLGRLLRGKVQERPESQVAVTHVVDAASIRARDAARRGFVTGVGVPRWDMREGLLAQIQVARLQYPASGTLCDYPVHLPWGVGAQTLGVGQPITWRLRGMAPPDTAVTLELFNAATATELASPGDGQYSAPGGNNVLVPLLTFTTSNAYRSPWLLAYSLDRPAVTLLSAPGEVYPDLQRVSITGTDTEPGQESAEFDVEDLLDQFPGLRQRGMIPVAIRAEIAGGTEEEPTLETITLFRGYTEHSPARPRTALSLSLETWHAYTVACSGMWARLEKAYWTQRYYFGEDPSVEGVPWKVTDALRLALGVAGFPAAMIDMPDHPMRFWASAEKGATNAAWLPQPGSDIGQWVVQMAWEYLGASLFFDPQAGALLGSYPIGMWRLRFQPRVTDAPLFRFVRFDAPEPAEPTLPHMLGAYSANTAWIEKDTWMEWTDPPEGNAVLVTGPGEAQPGKGGALQVRAWAINPNSVTVPAFGSTPPAGHRDRLPGFFPILDVVPWLPEGDAGLRAARWRCRRLYDVACRAWSGVAFTAPLAFLEDATDAQLFGRRRLLRYGDAVLVDDDPFWVTSVNPQYESDAKPMARYELQRFNDPVEAVL